MLDMFVGRQKKGPYNTHTLVSVLDKYFVMEEAGCCDTRWRSWLRHYATNRKVAGLTPDGIIGIFHYLNPSGRTTALGSTQPLTEMITMDLPWG